MIILIADISPYFYRDALWCDGIELWVLWTALCCYMIPLLLSRLSISTDWLTWCLFKFLIMRKTNTKIRLLVEVLIFAHLEKKVFSRLLILMHQLNLYNLHVLIFIYNFLFSSAGGACNCSNIRYSFSRISSLRLISLLIFAHFLDVCVKIHEH